MITDLIFKIVLDLELAATDMELQNLDNQIQDIGYAFYTGLQSVGVSHETADYLLNVLF